jgi:hypothetical protein
MRKIIIKFIKLATNTYEAVVRNNQLNMSRITWTLDIRL